MLARKPRKFDYNLSPLRPLKELNKLKMGCASSQAAVKEAMRKSADGITTVMESVKYPPAEAFEIPLDDEGEQVDSIIKKHPPKRLQRLTDATVASATIEDLEEKLAKAEIRRKNYLQQKIEGITTLAKSRDPEEDYDYSQVQDEKKADPDSSEP